MEEKPKITLEGKKENKQWDEVYKLISWWDTEKIQAAKVMVVGAGALGNEVLKNLALLNIGYIMIIDFDTIEYSNLSRSVLFREADCGRRKAEVAAERVREINPNVKVQHLYGDIGIDIGLGVFRRMDVVIGCLDNRVARLYINRLSHKVGKTWVDGAIENLAGQLDVFKPGTSCYECQLDEREMSIIRDRMSCPDIARRNANFGRIPTTPISSSIIGAMQVQEALKVIYGNEDKSQAGTRFKYDGMHNMFLQYPSGALDEDCPSHAKLPEIVEAKAISHQNTFAELMTWLKENLKEENPKLHLEDELVLELTTAKTEVSFPVMKIRGHLSDEFLSKFDREPGEDMMITESIQVLDKDFVKPEIALHDLGIPPLQVLTVETSKGFSFVELTGDENTLEF